MGIFGSASRSTTFAFIAEDKFSKTADKVSGKAGRMGGALGKAGKFAAVGASAAAAGVGILAAAGLKSVKVAEEQGTANAKLKTVLTSMGYKGHAKEAIKFADSLEQTIAVDSAIIKGAQTKLATFEDVAKSQDLMGRTTKLTADLAAAGFGSMDSAAVGLGKALQDPITGMSLLSRQGSLTKAQQKAIGDEFLRTGDKAKAQESILQALEKQVGGVAEASADSSDKMSLAFGEIVEKIGGKLQPAFDRLVPVALKLSDWFIKRAIPAMEDMGRKVIPVLRGAFDSVKQAIEDNRPGLEKLGEMLKTVGKFVVEKVLPIWIEYQTLIGTTLVKAFGILGDVLPPIVVGFLKGAKFIAGGFRGLFTVVTGAMEGILRTAEKTMGWIPGGVGDAIKDASASFTSFRGKTIADMKKVEGAIQGAADTVDDFNRRSKLETDIRGFTAKLRDAKRQLKDPELTKTREAEIRADISQLRQKRRDAMRELNSIPKSVTVQLKANMTVGGIKLTQAAATKFNRYNSGGMGGDGGAPGAGNVGHGLMAATRGVGSPGARFAQWGPYWSWNRRNGVGQHDGADIRAGYGTPVYATRSGTVYRRSGGWAGNASVLRADGGTQFIYAHLSSFGKSGRVRAGDMLGRVGSTGNSTGAHLHIQASRAGRYVNPAAWLAQGGVVTGPTVIGAGEAGPEAIVPLPHDWRSGRGGDRVQAPLRVDIDGRQVVAAVVAYERRTGRLTLTNA